VLARFAQIVQETKETDGEGASWMENFILQVQCKNKTELKERKKAAKQRKTFSVLASQQQALISQESYRILTANPYLRPFAESVYQLKKAAKL
jgi:hypothetical protein